MLDSQSFYIGIAVVGLVFLLLGLVLDDLFDIEGVFDLDFEAPWLNIRVLAFGIIGFGMSGFASAYLDVPIAWILVLATLGFLVASVFSFFLVLKPLLKQQSNSSISRQTYVGRTGKLTLGIREGDWGQVQFTDVNGAIKRELAITSNNEELPSGASVLIIDIEPESVIVTAYEPE